MKTALITGATSGIGLEIARSLATKRWRVLIHGRNPEKVRAACRDCGDDAKGFVADLSLVSDTRRLAADVRSQFPRLDSLVLNAGTVTPRREVTPEGFERMFAVNHLAPFLLTGELHPVIPEGGQILAISTDAHRWIGPLRLENLQAEEKFRVLKHYAATKAANLLTTFEWARRLAGAGIRVTAHHPGEVATNFGLHGPLWLRLFWKLSRRRYIKASDASGPIVDALTGDADPTPEPEYFSRGKKTLPAPFVLDTDLQRDLWKFTDSLL